jgi:hypothetical protein
MFLLLFWWLLFAFAYSPFNRRFHWCWHGTRALVWITQINVRCNEDRRERIFLAFFLLFTNSNIYIHTIPYILSFLYSFFFTDVVSFCVIVQICGVWLEWKREKEEKKPKIKKYFSAYLKRYDIEKDKSILMIIIHVLFLAN